MNHSQEELDVEEHCRSMKSRFGQWDQTGKQEAKLMLLDSERLHSVRKLLSLDCNDDPLWAQQLLEQLAPQLEEVQLWNVEKCHLVCLQNMPQLRRLEVEGWSEALEADPYKFPPLDPGIAGLQFLHVFLPKETSLSLIAAHGHSLKELEVYVGLKLRMNGRQWICKDLTKRLSACGLENLQGMVLRRGDEREGFHPTERCDAQIKSLSHKLPWVRIFCDKCENIPW
ncbi:uncharacterized protein LOC117646999 [Thrips palmi]|uniref:Uncharacterized protein LOC117646999 n=1 Tax=Thrips palmi TaxID=161013 RepID=A0A6P8ZPM4_THRPL|nr:uncharacterized protein LOC117646999 [Thrips palmi]